MAALQFPVGCIPRIRPTRRQRRPDLLGCRPRILGGQAWEAVAGVKIAHDGILLKIHQALLPKKTRKFGELTPDGPTTSPKKN
ncbi:hypothetical protein QJS10_CPA08g00377 [Acorus calamus]|uniref:Histone H2A C-terminal domain-containing protein n=1 Tax=Acorus calamus TaxID=4465 RepID=A0AAV9EB53_ACOCL|nr:hypothetical protein QJS10_CPA08g00377 [Acorus calamus]